MNLVQSDVDDCRGRSFLGGNRYGEWDCFYVLFARTSIIYGGLGWVYGMYCRLRCTCETACKKWRGQRQLRIQSSCIDRPAPTANDPWLLHSRPSIADTLFSSLAIEQLVLDSEFKVVNVLVVNHWWLWRLEMPFRFPCRTARRFTS